MLLALLLVGLVVVVLGVLALPLTKVESQAKQAKNELVLAADALKAKDQQGAAAHVAKAKASLAEANKNANGFGADVWSHVPVAGSAVSDMRRLLSALNASTTVADAALKIYPEVTDPKAVNDLMSAKGINLPKVQQILDQLGPAMKQLHTARADLDAIQADAPFVGPRIAEFRDQASAKVIPLADAADRLQPVADAFPELFGSDSPRHYLITFLNPAEERWSGGAPLAYVDMTITDGKLKFGTYQEANLGGRSNGNTWEGVPGNPWHAPGMRRLQKATYNPSWPISGEELLRGFKAKGLGNYDSLLALDVPAIALLMGPTGTVDVAGVGPVNQQNVVETLVGSYDKYETPEQRRVVNRAVADLFRAKFFGGGNVIQKARAISQAASERHLAVYSRIPKLQHAITEIGLAGSISAAKHDYIGVFSRNNNDSKTDFWQRRTVQTRVALTATGAARVHTKITLKNVAPPFQPHRYLPVDSGRGYYTKRLNARVLTILPTSASHIAVKQNGGKMLTGDFGGRPYFNIGMNLPRQTSRTASLSYDVKRAVTVTGDTMTYTLDYDPQGMVEPQKLGVSLKAPAGWHVTKVPAGWTITSAGATYGLKSSPTVARWQIVLERG